MASSGLNWDLQLFTSTFALIFIAELPDKTAFATLMMATQSQPTAVFLGVAGAFVVQSLVAILFGSFLSLLPVSVVRIGAALMFLGFAGVMWLRKGTPSSELQRSTPNPKKFLATVGSSFLVIFMAEWGDLTQLATATLQAKYHNPMTIFFAATMALWFATGLAVVLGNHAKRIINPEFLQKFAAIAFAGVGLVLLAGVYRAEYF